MESGQWRKPGKSFGVDGERIATAEVSNPMQIMYIIRSTRAIVSIRTLLEGFYKEFEQKNGTDEVKALIGIDMLHPQRIVDHETSNTYCVIDKAIYNLIRSKGFIQDFKIYPFDVTTNHYNYPNLRTSDYNYFIKLPPQMSLSATQDIIREYMNKLVSYGLFQCSEDQTDFRVTFPHSHRENNRHGGCCYVTFEDDVIRDHIALGRLFINDRFWPNTDCRIMCVWCKIRTTNSGDLPKPKAKAELKTEVESDTSTEKVKLTEPDVPQDTQGTQDTQDTQDAEEDKEFKKPKKARTIRRQKLNTVQFPEVTEHNE